MKIGRILVYSCACSNPLGTLAKKIAEEFDRNNMAEIIQLPGNFGNDKDFIANANSAKLNIAVDGCHFGCAHKALKSRKIAHKKIFLTDMGCVKGKTEVTDELVIRLFNDINSNIGDQSA